MDADGGLDDRPGPVSGEERAAPAVAADPAGRPYHRLVEARPGGRWWPLAGTVLIAALALLAVPLALMVAYVLPGFLLGAAMTVDPFTPQFRLPLAAHAHHLLILAALGPVVVGVAARLRPAPPGSLVSVADGVRWRWLAASLVPSAAAVLLTAGAGRLVTDAPGDATARWEHWAGWPEFGLAAAVYLTLVPLQAVGEELLRGWVVQATGAWLRSPWFGIVLGGATYLAAHPPRHLPGALAGLVTGAALAWLVVRTGGIEAAVVYHAVAGLTAWLLDAAFGPPPGVTGLHGWLELAFAVTQALVLVRLTQAFLACPGVAALLAPVRRSATAAAAAGRQMVAYPAVPVPAAAQEAGRMATASTSIR